MRYLIVGICLIVGMSIGSCRSKPPAPPQTVFNVLTWTPGKCMDNFIVYVQRNGQWIYFEETTRTKLRFEVTPKEEKVFTVAGICMTGPNIGEWQSAERVNAKW